MWCRRPAALATGGPSATVRGREGVPALFLTPQPYSWPPVCSLCLHTPSTCSFDEHPEPTQLGRLALAAPEEGLSLGLPELLGSG